MVWWTPTSLLLLKHLELARMVPVPLLCCCLWSVGVLSCPTKHAQCLSVSPQPSPQLPQYQFHSLWVFMRFAMTFHLGGLDIKALLFPELGEQVTLPLGRTCPKGAVNVQYY